LDLAAKFGSPVKAAKDGKVVFAGEKGGYGNLIVLLHPGGQSTYYGHLDTIDVKVGDKVQAGREMGSVGQTGMATGPHLHFEVRAKNGKPLDPMTVLAMGQKRVT
jgi:murein DD-endopeptidase MepM/ murein hydrolase activator NlpD